MHCNTQRLNKHIPSDEHVHRSGGIKATDLTNQLLPCTGMIDDRRTSLVSDRVIP